MIVAFYLKQAKSEFTLNTKRKNGFVSTTVKSRQKLYQNHTFFANYRLRLARLVTLTEIEAENKAWREISCIFGVLFSYIPCFGLQFKWTLFFCSCSLKRELKKFYTPRKGNRSLMKHKKLQIKVQCKCYIAPFFYACMLDWVVVLMSGWFAWV